MAREHEPGADLWDADAWTLEGLDIDKQEIARSEQEAGDERAETPEAYRERALAPLRRLAERLRASDEGVEEDPAGGVGEGVGRADGAVPAG